jgi:hypothetical protein
VGNIKSYKFRRVLLLKNTCLINEYFSDISSICFVCCGIVNEEGRSAPFFVKVLTKNGALRPLAFQERVEKLVHYQFYFDC